MNFPKIKQKPRLAIAFLLLGIVLVSCVAVGPLALRSQEPNDKQIQDIRTFNGSLSSLSKDYSAAKDESSKTQIRNNIESTIKERKKVMLNVIENNPASATEVALSSDARNQLPNDLKKDVEQSVQLQGELKTLIAEGKTDKDVRYYFYLETPKENIELHQPNLNDPELIKKTKAPVKAHGIKLDNEMALSGSSAVEPLTSTVPDTQNIPGPKKVAVLMFNFSNTSVSKASPLTSSQTKGIVYTNSDSVNNYYQTASLGKMSVIGKLQTDGDIYGWYTINHPSTSCDYDTWATAAKDKAQEAGVNLSGYDNITMVFPYSSSCFWSGLGELSGSLTWVNGGANFTKHTISHELGHNYGLLHAATRDCTNGSNQRVMVSSTCSVSEYGDYYDPMGNLGFYHFNNYNKGRLGLYAGSNTQTVSASGAYTILPQENNTTGVIALRIPISNKFYYLEYRKNADSYDAFASNSSVINGVTIRVGSDYSQLDYTYALDGTLNNTYASDRALPVGQTFTDSSAGITVTVLSVNTNGANVQITVTNPVPADVSAPTTPTGLTSTGSVRAGETTPYIFLSWGASTDNVGVTTYNIYRDGVQIGGNSGQFLSDHTFVDNSINFNTSYQYYIKARDAAGNLSAASNTVTTSVATQSPTDNVAPTVSWLNPFNGSVLSGTITEASNGCRVNATDNFGVDHVNFYLDNIVFNSDSATSWACTLDTTTFSNGAHTLKAVAYDAAGNSASASLTITINNAGIGCPTGDISGDCHVNVSDLSLLLSNYGSDNAACDLNNDGTVNITDMSRLLANYGQ